MSEMKPQMLKGPILLGLQQNHSLSAREKLKQSSPYSMRRVQGNLFALYAISAVGLAVGSLLHRQWAGLPWIGMVWAPLPLLLLSSILRRRLRRPDEQVISAIDWLKQQAKQQGLGAVLAKGARIVWLTSQGVYALPNRFFSWDSFVEVSLEEMSLGHELRPTLLLKFRLKRPRNVTKWLIYSFMGVCFLLSCAGALVSYIFFRHYGLRDDVLSLIFAVLAAFSLEGEIMLRYQEQHRQEKVDLEVLLDQQHVQLKELHSFIIQCLPEGTKLK